MSVVHAHRGASTYASENTMPAFRLAMEMGTDGFGNDIHLTKDKVFVVSHDASIARCSDGNVLIHESTLRNCAVLISGVGFRRGLPERVSPHWTKCWTSPAV